jgi:glutamyl-tRNA reductase
MVLIVLRIEENESYEQWLNRACAYEHALALKRIEKGEDINLVLEELSKNIMKKSLHPILKAIKDIPNNYDAEASRRDYKEKMGGRTGVADHVDD